MGNNEGRGGESTLPLSFFVATKRSGGISLASDPAAFRLIILLGDRDAAPYISTWIPEQSKSEALVGEIRPQAEEIKGKVADEVGLDARTGVFTGGK